LWAPGINAGGKEEKVSGTGKRRALETKKQKGCQVLAEFLIVL
jgi:hypothetical protein